MKEHYASPMPEEVQESFVALDYFNHDPAWRIEATFEPSEPTKISIESTAGTSSPYTQVGIARCTLEGASYDLMVLDDGDGGSFIPFRDATCGDEVYSGGRYVPLEADEGDASIDFNRAHNPWCVYDEEFTCPLPPPSNWITVRVPAGEKMFH